MIKDLKFKLEHYGDIFEYTDDEKEAVQIFMGTFYKVFNSLFVNNNGQYEVRNKMEECFVEGSEKARNGYLEQMRKVIAMLPQIYSAMLKADVRKPNANVARQFHRGTSMHEIDSLREDGMLNRALSTTMDEDGANWYSYLESENADSPVHLLIQLDENSDVPILNVKDITEDASAWERETIIAPFARVKDIYNAGKKPAYNGKAYDEYIVTLERPNLELLSKEDRDALKASVEERAPRIFDFLAQIVNSGSKIEVLNAEISTRRRLLTSLMQQERVLSGSDQELEFVYYSDEIQLRDLLNLWRYMASSPITQSDLENDSETRASIRRATELHRIDLGLEYTEEMHKYFCNSMNNKLARIHEACSYEDSFTNNVNETFEQVKKEMQGVSREELFAALEQITRRDYDGEVDFSQALETLEFAVAYFTKHLEKSDKDDYESLMDEQRRFQKSKRDFSEDRVILEREIREKEKKIKEIEDSIAQAKPEIQRWKADIIRLCQSDCRQVELEFEEKIQAIEHSQTTAQAQKEPEELQPTDTERAIEVCMQIEQAFICDIVNLKGDAGKEIDKRYVDKMGERNKKTASLIQELSGTAYDARIPQYQKLMNELGAAVGDLKLKSENEEVARWIIDSFSTLNVDELHSSGQDMASEIVDVYNHDENLLKKLAFERFRDIAIQAEVSALRDELEHAEAKASNKPRRLVFFAQESEESVENSQIQQMRRYIDAGTSIIQAREQDGTETISDEYSCREIIAEIQIFVEEHGEDERYKNAIEKVKALEKMLSEHFNVSFSRNSKEKSRNDKGSIWTR